MANEKHRGFPGLMYPLEFISGKPLVNLTFLFYEQDGETEVNFEDQTGCTFKVWEDNDGGKLLLSLSESSGINSADNIKVLNASASQMNIERGKYYYEFSYYTTGGYEIVLMFSEVKFL